MPGAFSLYHTVPRCCCRAWLKDPEAVRIGNELLFIVQFKTTELSQDTAMSSVLLSRCASRWRFSLLFLRISSLYRIVATWLCDAMVSNTYSRVAAPYSPPLPATAGPRCASHVPLPELYDQRCPQLGLTTQLPLRAGWRSVQAVVIACLQAVTGRFLVEDAHSMGGISDAGCFASIKRVLAVIADH